MESYELIRSRRRTLALEITRDCRVLVRAPLRLSQAKIDAFVESHAAWIQTHLERQRQQKPGNRGGAAMKRCFPVWQRGKKKNCCPCWKR